MDENVINLMIKADKKKLSHKGGLNSRPFAYEATALPLSYCGSACLPIASDSLKNIVPSHEQHSRVICLEEGVVFALRRGRRQLDNGLRLLERALDLG